MSSPIAANRQAQPKNEAAPAGGKKSLDLEIKDAQLIFQSVWQELVEERGEENLIFPREIFWLNGAPGAGKGTQTEFIMDYIGLTARPIVVSELLDSPEARRRKDAGMMANDREVTALLLRALLEPERRTGVVVDGFPRTQVQVECLKHFFQTLRELRSRYVNTRFEGRFHKPIFHIIVLYVDEPVSVQRQLTRGRQAQEHNERVRITGLGEELEIRKTDLSEDAARNRYKTFKDVTFDALRSLRAIFHYHFVNATDSIEAVQEKIIEELRYQSSLELETTTYDLVARLPVAESIAVHARQDLVERLDNYALHHRQLFEHVIGVLEERFIPIVRRHAISGRAYVSTEDPIFENALSLAMAIDIFSERGYHAAVDLRQEEIPDRVDLETGRIITRRKRVYRFLVNFSGSVIRRGH